MLGWMMEHSEWEQHKAFGNLLCGGLPTDLCVDGTSGLSPYVARLSGSRRTNACSYLPVTVRNSLTGQLETDGCTL